MPQEYARLDLLHDVKTKDGVTSKEVIVLRPTCRDMTAVVDEPKVSEQLNQFVARCCRITNGSGKLSEFSSSELDAADGAELASMIVAMSEEADKISAGGLGDGVNEPIVYTLTHPIRLSPAEDADTVTQIQFQARRIGDLSDFLDAHGASAEFYAFMRAFGTLLGTRLPMSDAVVGALDFLDYLVIRRQIMGKLVTSRGRWKRAST